MRTREEQAKSLRDSLCADYVSAPVHEAGYELAMRHIEEAEHRAEQRVRAEIGKRHTWFYMVDDPESGHADMADMLCETKPFEIVETSEAADIRIFFAYQDEDGEIYEFPTRAEAEQAASKAIDAAREAKYD